MPAARAGGLKNIISHSVKIMKLVRYNLLDRQMRFLVLEGRVIDFLIRGQNKIELDSNTDIQFSFTVPEAMITLIIISISWGLIVL